MVADNGEFNFTHKQTGSISVTDLLGNGYNRLVDFRQQTTTVTDDGVPSAGELP